MPLVVNQELNSIKIGIKNRLITRLTHCCGLLKFVYNVTKICDHFYGKLCRLTLESISKYSSSFIDEMQASKRLHLGWQL